MHRPPLRVHARDLNRQAGILKAFMVGMHPSMILNAIGSLVKRFKRHYGGGRSYPRCSAREKLRRRVGGFAGLHDHTLYLAGAPWVYWERRCPVCDLGMTHAEVARAEGVDT